MGWREGVFSFAMAAACVACLCVLASCGGEDAAAGETVEVTVRRETCPVTSYHDAATGCEYVRTGCGGLTPRLSPEGRPLCRPFNPGAGAQ